jgi:hypothetical protein
MSTTKSNYELAQENVRVATKGTKIVESEISTGTSFFEGKKRLCKVLKSKKSLAIEVNVTLDKATEEKFNLTKISYATAKAKHLGTMKYLVNLVETKDMALLVKAMVIAFKAEQVAEKAAQDIANAQ